MESTGNTIQIFDILIVLLFRFSNQHIQFFLLQVLEHHVRARHARESAEAQARLRDFFLSWIRRQASRKTDVWAREKDVFDVGVEQGALDCQKVFATLQFGFGVRLSREGQRRFRFNFELTFFLVAHFLYWLDRMPFSWHLVYRNLLENSTCHQWRSGRQGYSSNQRSHREFNILWVYVVNRIVHV